MGLKVYHLKALEQLSMVMCFVLLRAQSGTETWSNEKVLFASVFYNILRLYHTFCGHN